MDSEKLLNIEDELQQIACGAFLAYVLALTEDGEDEAEAIAGLLEQVAEGFDEDAFVEGVMSFLEGHGYEASEDEEGDDYEDEDE